MSPKLTCLIPCRNEENNIGACIESFLPIADEVLIADSLSTDRTLEVVEQIGGCRVIEREYGTSGDFKNWAIPQASHEWVLLMDADERVTPKLRDEIKSVLQSGPKYEGYWIYRNNHFMGHRVRSCGWNNDGVIRLFRRDLARYAGKSDHARIDIPASRLGKLRQEMDHYTYWSYDKWLSKFDRYAKVQAEIWYDEGVQPSYRRMLLRPPLRFLRDYLLQYGILDGKVGLQISMLSAFYSFMKQARLWELYHAKEQVDFEPQILPFARPSAERLTTPTGDSSAEPIAKAA